MSTVKVATSDLIGAPLDWVVGLIEGAKPTSHGRIEWVTWDLPFVMIPGLKNNPLNLQNRGYGYCPSIESNTGAPLLHKHAVALEPIDPFTEYGVGWWAVCINAQGERCRFHGETPLIAGLRAIVGAAKGNTVEIPTELLEQSA